MLVLALATYLNAADPAQQLLAHGDFEAVLSGLPTGISQEIEGGNHYLRLTASPGKMVTLYREIDVTGLKNLQLSFRERHHGVKIGDQKWFDARLMLEFKDAARASVKGAPAPPHFQGTAEAWTPHTLHIVVPETATWLAIMPAMFQAAEGTFDIDDVEVIAVDH